MSEFRPSCRIKPNVAGDWQIMPPGPTEITQVGDVGGPLTAYLVGPDDFNASGKVEVTGNLCVIGVTPARNAMELADDLELDDEADISFWGEHNELAWYRTVSEEKTIAVGTGSAGVWGPTSNLLPANSVILSVVTRITQAPGGGATDISVGRWPGNWQEFLEEGPVALGSVSTWATDGFVGGYDGPSYNAVADWLLYTTDNDVTVSDMKIRVTSTFIEFYPPES